MRVVGCTSAQIGGKCESEITSTICQRSCANGPLQLRGRILTYEALRQVEPSTRQMQVHREGRTTLAVPAPTVETMPAAVGMAEEDTSSEKKPKNRNGADDPPANTVAPAQ